MFNRKFILLLFTVVFIFISVNLTFAQVKDLVGSLKKTDEISISNNLNDKKVSLKLGAVIGHGVKVRSGPSSSDKAIYDVLYGTKFEILDEKNDFIKAKFEDGTIGWISKQFITTSDKNLLSDVEYSPKALEEAYNKFKSTYDNYIKNRNKNTYDEFKKAYFEYRRLAKLSPEYKTLEQNPALTKIIVDKNTYTLTVYLNDKPVRAYPIAYGANPDGKDKQKRGDSRTPEGNFKILYKDKRQYEPVATRGMWLDTKWGDIGIHGTPWPDSIGSKASHGCIRMYAQDSVELYKLVRVGTPVTILGLNKNNAL